MKDEEMAEEWVKENMDCCRTDNSVNQPIPYFSEEERCVAESAFLAGLKAGRPQWHDLRKDPNDLPKDNDEKLCFYGKGKVVARYDSEYGCWDTYFNNLETVIPSSVIIAWCEIPTFDKE